MNGANFFKRKKLCDKGTFLGAGGGRSLMNRSVAHCRHFHCRKKTFFMGERKRGKRGKRRKRRRRRRKRKAEEEVEREREREGEGEGEGDDDDTAASPLLISNRFHCVLLLLHCTAFTFTVGQRVEESFAFRFHRLRLPFLIFLSCVKKWRKSRDFHRSDVARFISTRGSTSRMVAYDNSKRRPSCFLYPLFPFLLKKMCSLGKITVDKGTKLENTTCLIYAAIRPSPFDFLDRSACDRNDVSKVISCRTKICLKFIFKMYYYINLNSILT